MKKLAIAFAAAVVLSACPQRPDPAVKQMRDESAALQKRVSAIELRVASLEQRPPAKMGEAGEVAAAEALGKEVLSGIDAENAQRINTFCREKWGDDFKMVNYCIDLQTEAAAKVHTGELPGIPQNVYNTIRADCDQKWLPDYTMEWNCMDEQGAAFRKLNRR